MSKSAFVGAALMASLASEVFSSPTLKFAPRDPWYAAQHAEDHSYHNNPVHVPYPSYLLETHEVRQGVGEYIASVFNPPTDHNYGLRDSESFYWGMGGLPLTNFTTYAHEDNYKILSLERHKDVLNTAKCDKDTVVLTFDYAHFDQVKQAWSWVNDDTANHIILVTDNADCNIPDGDPTLRQPWEVSSISFDKPTGHVTLEATPKTWQEAFGTSWRLQGGNKPIVNNPTRSGSAHDKRITISGSPSVNLAHDIGGIGVDIDGTDLKLSCDPCSTTGSLDFKFDIVPYVVPPHLSGTFSVTGNGIGAAIGAKLSATKGTDGKNFNKEILDVPIPDAGISIGKLVNLGFNLKLELGGNVGKVEAAVEATAGIKVTVPDNSLYVLDFDDSSKNQNSGWSPSVEPILEISADVAVSASVGPMLTLEVDAEVAGVGGAIGMALAGPTFQAEAKASADSEGVCDSTNTLAGVEFDMNIQADIHAFESANLIVAHPAATQTFFATSWPVFSTCIGVAGVSTSPPTVTPTSTPPPVTSSAPYPTTNGTYYTV